VSRPGGGAVRAASVRLGALTPALLVLALAHPPAAPAAQALPHWSILSESEPTDFVAGASTNAYVLLIRNDGAGPTASGSEVTVTDVLPAGVTATKVTATGEGANGKGLPKYVLSCPHGEVSGSVVCTYEEGLDIKGEEQGRILPGATIAITIVVSIEAGANALEANTATVSGGGAPSATVSEATPLAPPAPFGLALLDAEAVGPEGTPDTQAASHPFELTASLALNVDARETPSEANGHGEAPLASGAARDVEVTFPPGLAGDPSATPRCSQQAFLEREALNCPVDTQVGTVKAFFYGSFHAATYPVFNIVPPAGEPAELGFSVAGIGHIPIFFHVHGGVDEDGRLTAQLSELPETGPWQGAILTLWGVPADRTHDLEREGTLGEGAPEDNESCKPSVEVVAGVEEDVSCPSGVQARAFLTMPSECASAELGVSAELDSWEQPAFARFPPAPGPAEPQVTSAITGCELLTFTPTLALAPESEQAGEPSGYTLELHMPQNEDPSALAAPELRSAAVALPAGVVISPSSANGLQACSPAQFEPPPRTSDEPPISATGETAAAECPRQSQIGTVKVSTPLLSQPLEGQVYLGQPQCEPCGPADAQDGRLLRLLVQAQGPGVVVKLAGDASIDQADGQVTVHFERVPELPIEAVKLTLDGGPTAPLANPWACGTPLAASSQLRPYSSETPAQPGSEPFELGGCATPGTFAPSFVAGTTNNQAGAYSPLSVTLARSDQDQQLQAASVTLPPGLLATIAKVPLCTQAQAEAQACAQQSEVGTATVAAGPGAYPLYLKGHVYLTGPYEGAPFGLSIVVAAKVGPLDLGTIALRARIEVDPVTAALRIVTDALPQTLDGIPLQLRTVNVDVDREGFAFNPTSCRALAVAGTLWGAGGASAVVSSRYQASGCARLPFAPKLGALTHAHASKASGVHLHVRITSPAGAANIAKLALTLPRRIVARLSTLQKACPAGVFAANPAGCGAGSAVGSATVLTPVLRAPLEGPVYLLSRGASGSPEIALALRAEGVRIEVVGQAHLTGKAAWVSFASVPDAPVSELDVTLDAGRRSLLVANLPARARASMCGQRLRLRTTITAQNGAVVKRDPRIAVSGCGRGKAYARSRRAAKRRAAEREAARRGAAHHRT